MATRPDFTADRRGNFAIFGALVAIPLILGAGVALDLGTITRHKSELQQALDGAALAVAREGKGISDEEAQQIARAFVMQNKGTEVTDLRVVREDGAVTVHAQTVAPTSFGDLFGYDRYPVVAAATAEASFIPYEVALVLDTTGSMKGGKLVAMKDAVVGLVGTLSDQIPDPERLQFAVVPFSNFVNVGPQYAPEFDEKGKLVKNTGAPWLDVRGKVKVPQLELDGVSRFEVFENLDVGWAGCVETRTPTKKEAHDTADTPADDKKSLFVPALSIDEPGGFGFENDYIDSPADPLDKSKTGKAKKLKKYGATDGLIGSVIGTDDEDDDDDDDDNEDSGGGAAGWEPVPANLTGGKGPNATCYAQPLLPLTSDYDAVIEKVKSLEAQGNTNIMEGVAWGHRVISPGEPFTGGRDPAKDRVQKVMIVLTDGANVFGNKWNSLGSAYSSFGYLVDGRLGVTAASSSKTNALMNDKTLEACTHAKESGVEVYTIRLEEPDKATGTMLQDCASTPAHYFDTPSRSELDATFEKIRQSILRIRISS